MCATLRSRLSLRHMEAVWLQPYRLLRPDEEERAIVLWAQALETSAGEARATFRDFQDSPQRFAQAHAAIANDGQVLATICYWLRDIRDRAGELGSSLHSVDDAALYGYAPFMVKPIGATVASPFDAPDGLFWPLDAY